MITKEEVQHVASLARIELTGKEIEMFQKDFSQILKFFETLKEADVTGADPMTHVIALKNVTRDDVGQRAKPEVIEKLIRMAPQTQTGYVKVPKVL